jgi:hypothetical protein
VSAHTGVVQEIEPTLMIVAAVSLSTTMRDNPTSVPVKHWHCMHNSVSHTNSSQYSADFKAVTPLYS